MSVNMDCISYRSIREEDFDEIKSLHEECFPIRYGDKFYKDACKGIGIDGGELFTWIAVETAPNQCQSEVSSSSSSSASGHGKVEHGTRERVVGFIFAQFLPAAQAEDRYIFDSSNMPEKMFYILTLGSMRTYRRIGLGSALLAKCTDYAETIKSCGAVFLHVIHYNTAAIKFYERNDFEYFRELSAFYFIDEQYWTAYLYVKYMHGFDAPFWHRLIANAQKATVATVSSWILWATSWIRNGGTRVLRTVSFEGLLKEDKACKRVVSGRRVSQTPGSAIDASSSDLCEGENTTLRETSVTTMKEDIP